MSYFVKLISEDLSRYLNKIESVGLRKAQWFFIFYIFLIIWDLTVLVTKCLHFLALHHGSQISWHVQESSVSRVGQQEYMPNSSPNYYKYKYKHEEITSSSTYVFVNKLWLHKITQHLMEQN